MLHTIHPTSPGSEFVKYKGQLAYTESPRSALMCTSVSLHWALACLSSPTHPQCSEAQMTGIMRRGLKTHEEVCDVTGRGMLQVCEVLQHYPLPLAYSCREIYGCVGHTPPTELAECCVALEDLCSLLGGSPERSPEHVAGDITKLSPEHTIRPPQTFRQAPLKTKAKRRALLFTAGGHTSALLRSERGLFHFDPVVAAVQRLSCEGVSRVLARAHTPLVKGTDFSVAVLG